LKKKENKTKTILRDNLSTNEEKSFWVAKVNPQIGPFLAVQGVH
jgi:hypothetical protein